MHARTLIATGLLGSLAATTAAADDDLWFGAKAGTLGVGLEATWRPLPYFDVRGGANMLTFDSDGSEAGIDYDGEVDLRTLYATANLRCPLSPFRVTAGLFNNGNEISLRSEAASSYEIGGQTYTAAEVGTLNAGADFDSIAPYVGVGLDFRLADTIGLNFDLGVLQQGSATVAMSADGPIADNPAFMAELELERAELQDEVEDYEYYPVVSIGLSWNF